MVPAVLVDGLEFAGLRLFQVLILNNSADFNNSLKL